MILLLLTACDKNGYEVRVRQLDFVHVIYTCTQWTGGYSNDLRICETAIECNQYCDNERKLHPPAR